MKVCYILPTLDHATGWGRWTIDLLEGVVEQGVEPVLIVPASQRDLHADLPVRKYETYFWGPEPYTWFHQLYRINFRGVKDLFSIKKNFSQLRGRGISLIHAADLYPWGFFAAQLRDEIEAPVILTNHSKLLFNPALSLVDLALSRKCVAAASKVVSVSDWASNELQAELGMTGPKFISVRNGVNVERFGAPAGGPGDKTVKPAGPVLLSVTRFMRLKGIETSVMAFKKLKASMPEAKYYIVGPHTDRRYVAKIRRLISDNGIQDVYMPGKVENMAEMRKYYQSADVLLHTSRWESFGLVFLEAGLFGVPVVASDVGGVSEAVADGETGLLVPQGNVEATADALLRVLGDPALARRLGKNNCRKALASSTRHVASAYCDLYAQTIRDGLL